MVNVSCEFRRISSVPNELVVVQESCVFDQTEALLHSVDKGLDFQVGHLIQWEEADAPKNIQQVARLQVERLQILQTTRETHTHTKNDRTQEKDRSKVLVYPSTSASLQSNKESRIRSTVIDTQTLASLALTETL